MDFNKIVFEAKDVKGFTSDFKELTKQDAKLSQLLRTFKKDEDKIVDYIDYVMSKYGKHLDQLMKKYNIGYDESIELMIKGN